MKNIFIPFYEGTIRYDCRRCLINCCARGDIALNSAEKKNLLQIYPELKFFQASNPGDKLYFISKEYACWFLSEGRLCEIEVRKGYAHKPFICRLHPFYVYTCADQYVILPKNCPSLFAARESKFSSHKRILQNAKEAIENNFVIGKIPLTRKNLLLEQQVFRNSKEFFKHSNYLDFASRQCALADRRLSESKCRADLEEKVALLKSFLEIDGLSLENGKISYELTVMTPLLRMFSHTYNLIAAKDFPLVFSFLYVYLVLYSSINETGLFFGTYTGMLNFLKNSGLLALKDEDLRTGIPSLEDRLLFLRRIRLMERKRREKESPKNRDV